MLVHRFGQTFDVLSTDERVTLRVGRASRLLAAEKRNCMRPTIGLLRHDTWLRGKRNQVRIHELLGRSMDHQLRGMLALNQVRHLRDPVMRLSLLASGIACVVVGAAAFFFVLSEVQRRTEQLQSSAAANLEVKQALLRFGP